MSLEPIDVAPHSWEIEEIEPDDFGPDHEGTDMPATEAPWETHGDSVAFL